MIEMRPATQADWLAWYNSLPPSRVRAWVIADGSALLAIGGLKYGGPRETPCVFFALKAEARGLKKTIHKSVMTGLADVLHREPAVLAIRDENEATADRWLKRLGFVSTGLVLPQGEVYRHG